MLHGKTLHHCKIQRSNIFYIVASSIEEPLIVRKSFSKIDIVRKYGKKQLHCKKLSFYFSRKWNNRVYNVFRNDYTKDLRCMLYINNVYINIYVNIY